MTPLLLLLLHSLCLYYSYAEPVKIGVLLPSDENLPWTAQRILPALDIAVANVNRLRLLPARQLRLIYRDSKCSSTDGPLEAADLHCKEAVHCFIGPACDYALAPVARFSTRWGTPVLTAGGMANAFQNKTTYGFLTRMMGSFNKLGEFVVRLMDHYDWSHVGFIFSRFKNRSVLRSNCFFAMEALYLAVKTRGGNPWYHSFGSGDDFDADDILDKARNKARVLIMCASPDEIRRIMIRAQDRLAMEEYVFIDIDLFSGDSGPSNTWYREDDEQEVNAKARRAYEGLLTVRLRTPTSAGYRAFSYEVKRRAMAMYANYSGGPEEISSFAGAFHDSLILYALALNETLESGGNITDGAAITRSMWNRTFEGVSGTVSIDSNGDRDMDYLLLDMNPLTGNFEVVANYYGNRKIISPVPAKRIHWAGGRMEPPPDTPICGFRGERCASDGDLPIST